MSGSSSLGRSSGRMMDGAVFGGGRNIGSSGSRGAISMMGGDHGIYSIPSAPSAPSGGTDLVSERLAALARASLEVRNIVLAAAAGTANEEEMRRFGEVVESLRITDNAEADITGKRSKPTKPPYRDPACYTQPFLAFINENPTVFHAVAYFESKLLDVGFRRLSEREDWVDGPTPLEKGGKYFVTRNGSSIIAFIVGEGYTPGTSGVGMVAGHIDALTARVKPIAKKGPVEGYTMLGVAPYAGALNSTWFDRDLGIGGRVVVRQSDGSIKSRLVRLGWPIARIPTLAPHFGQPSVGPFNKETQMVPIIGLEGSDSNSAALSASLLASGARPGTFAATQPPRLVQLISSELGITDYSSILSWELELFDTQPGCVGGMDKELIFAPRIDDKLCSWAALEALIEASQDSDVTSNKSISLCALFDDEEIGSRLRQGAAGNFLPGIVERVVDAFSCTLSKTSKAGKNNLLSQTYANSFLISADVTHAVNPNFLSSYLKDHMPRLNTGLTIAADPNGHMTTDALSTTFLSEIARLTPVPCAPSASSPSSSKPYTLQTFQIRNDSRSGGTVGPMLSSAMGVRAIDAGLAQLSMHSIRATTGSRDPGLGVVIFRGFWERWEEVDEEMRGIA